MIFKKTTIIFFLCLLSVFCFAASQQTSSTTAASLINEAEVLLNDSDNDMWTAAELLTWLNHGMVDIVRRTHCLEATESIDLATTTLEYTITSTYLTVKAVHYVDADSKIWALKKGSPSSVGQNTTATIPKYWYDWGGKIGVYPTFTRTSEKITVYYITRPTAIAASANVTTPAIYDSALVLYMVAHAYRRDLQYQKYTTTMALYEAELDRARMDLTEYPKEIVE